MQDTVKKICVTISICAMYFFLGSLNMKLLQVPLVSMAAFIAAVYVVAAVAKKKWYYAKAVSVGLCVYAATISYHLESYWAMTLFLILMLHGLLFIDYVWLKDTFLYNLLVNYFDLNKGDVLSGTRKQYKLRRAIALIELFKGGIEPPHIIEWLKNQGYLKDGRVTRKGFDFIVFMLPKSFHERIMFRSGEMLSARDVRRVNLWNENMPQHPVRLPKVSNLTILGFDRPLKDFNWGDKISWLKHLKHSYKLGLGYIVEVPIDALIAFQEKIWKETEENLVNLVLDEHLRQLGETVPDDHAQKMAIIESMNCPPFYIMAGVYDYGLLDIVINERS